MKNLILITMVSLFLVACSSVPVIASSSSDDDQTVITTTDEGSTVEASVSEEQSPSLGVKIAKALGFDIWKLLSMVMGLISIVAGSFWKLAKKKLRILVYQGELFCNAIEDNNIDANEQISLVENWRKLISK